MSIAERRLDAAVLTARRAGRTWARIALVLQVSAEAARRRFGQGIEERVVVVGDQHGQIVPRSHADPGATGRYVTIDHQRIEVVGSIRRGEAQV